MTEYVARHLQLDLAQASRVRNDYWEKYGATLHGLMRHHGTAPAHFLAQTHDFADLSSMVLPDPLLRQTILRLKGRKVVFSNAPEKYAREVLKILKIDDLFEDVFAIESMKYRPKPQAYGFFRLLRKMRISPRRCVMVEDTALNLKPAKKIGMKTVWIAKTLKKPAHVDLKLTTLAQLARKQQLL